MVVAVTTATAVIITQVGTAATTAATTVALAVARGTDAATIVAILVITTVLSERMAFLLVNPFSAIAVTAVAAAVVTTD